jgi:hypothetical protein
VTELLQNSNTSNPNGPAATTGFQSADPWVCPNVGSGAPANTPLHCVIAGAGFPASGTSVINVNVYVPIGTVSGEVQNCATAAANQTPQLAAVPAVASNQSCVPLPGGPKPPVNGNPIKVKKVVISNAPAPVGDLQFPITVTCVKGTNGDVLDNEVTHTVADGQTVDYMPYAEGFNCSANEGTIPQTNACGKKTPVWTTTYATQPVAMTSAGETITVTNTLNCKSIDVPIQTKPPVLNCDERTTKFVNGQCRCIIQGQTPISQTACGCPKGTELQKGQCVKPKPVCPQGTRFNDGRNRCEPICRDGQEYNASRNVCLTPKPICRQGTHYNPATNSCAIDKPVCKRGQKYDAATNRCINMRPVCEPGTQYNPKRNTCVPVEQRCPRGTIKVRGLCVDIPRCQFPMIPVPGTGICVNPFGGGGKPPPRTDGGAVPGL